jgi:hypothetical protein
VTVACAANEEAHEKVAAADSGVTVQGLASVALANLGRTACGTNSQGSWGYGSSCNGNGGQPEYWCSDFVRWVWRSAGIDVSELDAAAGSFYVYGQNHGTLSNTPHMGDAVVFNYHGNGRADHVAIVTRVNDDGTIVSVSGDWNGKNGTEAEFSSTSDVEINAPAYPATVGSSSVAMEMALSGFISAVGVTRATFTGNPCAGQGDGLYCGEDGVPGDPNTLYHCSGGMSVGSQDCANGCAPQTGTTDDLCVPTPPPPVPCAGQDDGLYCGLDGVPGDPNTLYQCANDALVGSQVCTNGCQINSGNQNDSCALSADGGQ